MAQADVQARQFSSEEAILVSKNIQACLEQLEWTPDSLAIKADVPVEKISSLKIGVGLTEGLFETLSNILGCRGDELLLDFDDDENRADRLGMVLMDAGLLTFDDGEEVEDDVPSPEQVEGADSLADEDVVEEGDTASAEPTRETLAKNVRAIMKKAGRAVLKTLTEAGLDPMDNKFFLHHYVQGAIEISKEQFEKICELCGVEYEVLVTGEGLEGYYPKPKQKRARNALVPVMRSVELPPVTDAQLASFFKGRVARKGVELINGLETGDLLEMVVGGEDIDWAEVWYTKTAEGDKFRKLVDRTVSAMSTGGDSLKVFLFMQLAAEVWSQEAEDE